MAKCQTGDQQRQLTGCGLEGGVRGSKGVNWKAREVCFLMEDIRKLGQVWGCLIHSPRVSELRAFYLYFLQLAVSTWGCLSFPQVTEALAFSVPEPDPENDHCLTVQFAPSFLPCPCSFSFEKMKHHFLLSFTLGGSLSLDVYASCTRRISMVSVPSQGHNGAQVGVSGGTGRTRRIGDQPHNSAHCFSLSIATFFSIDTRATTPMAQLSYDLSLNSFWIAQLLHPSFLTCQSGH